MYISMKQSPSELKAYKEYWHFYFGEKIIYTYMLMYRILWNGFLKIDIKNKRAEE